MTDTSKPRFTGTRAQDKFLFGEGEWDVYHDPENALIVLRWGDDTDAEYAYSSLSEPRKNVDDYRIRIRAYQMIKMLEDPSVSPNARAS